MKKYFIIGFAAVLAAVVSFAGCELTENSSPTDTAKIAAARSALAIPAETDRDLDLPAVLHGVAISWASSDETVISSTGHVARGLYGAEATLTATLALGGASDVKEFAVTVRTIIEEAAELFELNFSPVFYLNFDWAYILMKYSDENVIFNCSTDNGLLSVNTNIVKDAEKKVSVLSGDYVWWHDFERGEDGYFIHIDDDTAFIEIVLKLEENIIGYAVVQPYWTEPFYYFANLLKSVFFPQVDGEYQNVSEEYVTAAIEKIKAENKRGNL